MIEFILNNQNIKTNHGAGTTVLDFVRYHKHLTGTKIGCREGDCGACTILVGRINNGILTYQSMTSCLMPLKNAQGKHIVTIEGINMKELSPVQHAIVEEGGTQCGFCTIGFVNSLTGFVLSEKEHTYKNAIAAIDGNICRCTGYKSLERAAMRISTLLKDKTEKNTIPWLIKNNFIPAYFSKIEERLKRFKSKKDKLTYSLSDGVIIGGGTDLFVQRPEEMAKVSVLPFYDQKALKKIEKKNGFCYIGASSTVSDIEDSDIMQSYFSELPAFIKLISSTPIRNMATLAGNLVNASPIGDLTIFFLALDSSLVLNNKGQKREIKLRHFYKAYKTLDKNPEEFIEELFFKCPDESTFFNFEKVSKRTHLDIATVNAACLLKVENNMITKAHFSAGGVGPTPKYLEKTSAALLGKSIDANLLLEAAKILQKEVSPISDARGSKEYKLLLLRQLFYAHFLKFFPNKLSLSALI